jgi:hypothetical protein
MGANILKGLIPFGIYGSRRIAYFCFCRACWIRYRSNFWCVLNIRQSDGLASDIAARDARKNVAVKVPLASLLETLAFVSFRRFK